MRTGFVRDDAGLGIHGIIEFSNRLLTIVLTIVVMLVFLIVLRMRRQRRDLFVLTLIQGLSIPFQAVLGGITVLSGLNPYVVGSHFLVSVLLVILTTILVYRVYNGRAGKGFQTPGWYVPARSDRCFRWDHRHPRGAHDGFGTSRGR